MNPIMRLPHHVEDYFEVYFLHRNSKEGNNWYGDEKAKQNGENLIRT